MMATTGGDVGSEEIAGRVAAMRKSMNEATLIALKRRSSSRKLLQRTMVKSAPIPIRSTSSPRHPAGAYSSTPEEIRRTRRNRKRSTIRKQGINRMLSMEVAKKVRQRLRRQGSSKEVESMAPLMTYNDLAKFTPRPPPEGRTPSPDSSTAYWMARNNTAEEEEEES